jgi:DNA invertase Pin-like site-specific DNA recombinase
MKIGYARVSSTGQSLELQLEALQAAGCEKIYSEKESGRSLERRTELERAIDDLRAGDELIVTRLDRLARSVADLYGLLQKITTRRAGFICLQQSGVDVTSSTGKLLLGILGVVAEFENDLRRERQREGIEKAKAAGVYRGKQASIDPAKVLAAYAELGAAEAARKLGIARSSVYRVIGEQAHKAAAGEPCNTAPA